MKNTSSRSSSLGSGRLRVVSGRAAASASRAAAARVQRVVSWRTRRGDQRCPRYHAQLALGVRAEATALEPQGADERASCIKESQPQRPPALRWSRCRRPGSPARPGRIQRTARTSSTGASSASSGRSTRPHTCPTRTRRAPPRSSALRAHRNATPGAPLRLHVPAGRALPSRGCPPRVGSSWSAFGSSTSAC